MDLKSAKRFSCKRFPVSLYMILTVFSATPALMPPATFVDIADVEGYTFYSSVFKGERMLGSRETVAIYLFPMLFPPSFHCNHPLPRDERQMVEATRDAGRGLARWRMNFDLGRPYLLVSPLEMHRLKDVHLQSTRA